MDWKEIADAWLAPRRGGKWFAKEQGYVERLTPYLQDLDMRNLEKADLIMVRDELLANLGAATVNRYMGVIRAALIFAQDRNMIEKRPQLKKLKETKRDRWIMPDEAERLIAAAHSPLSEMIRFVLATGLRSFNVRNLEWSEINLFTRWASIPGSKMKNGQTHKFPLNDAAMAVLEAQSEKQSPWVFPVNYAGESGPMSVISVSAWRRACNEAGISDFTFHDLRHTWASWHAMNGTTMQELMALGGWTDPHSAARYQHLAPDGVSAAAERMGQKWLSSPEQTSPDGSKSASSKPESSCDPCDASLSEGGSIVSPKTTFSLGAVNFKKEGDSDAER